MKQQQQSLLRRRHFLRLASGLAAGAAWGPFVPLPPTPAQPLAALGTARVPWTISPWWDNGNQPEIGEGMSVVIPGRTPIQYPAIWERERETLGYNPRFLANTVSFDRRNRPVIRVGVHVHGEVGEHATRYECCRYVEKVYIQTLNSAGTWIALSLDEVMREQIPDWHNDGIGSGTHQSEERVAFDALGDAYTIVMTEHHGDFLLHSRDDMITWDVYALPVADVHSYRIEMTASDRPPVILVNVINADESFSVSIIAPTRKSNGTLDGFTLIDVSSKAISGPAHSGVGDVTVTVHNKTHVVYAVLDAVDGGGTPQYIRTYDHSTHRMTGPVLLGTTGGGAPDEHNGPAVVVDSRGFLHVVLGAHNQPYKYTVSTRPNDATAWEEAVELGHPGSKETYVGLVIDRDDTLHLVSRMGITGDVWPLHYLRKQRNAHAWGDRGEFVIPAHKDYSSWYHKLTIDRRGTLCLAYFYYAHNLTEGPDGELAAYQRKWPEEGVTCGGPQCGIKAHDPVLLMSGGGGDRWQIATTPDFHKGMS
jgi:BNR repeat-containing family member